MNRKATVLITLFFSTILIFSCSSLGRQEEQKKIDSDSAPCIDNSGPELPEGWKYETEVTHKGSRSEGSISRLFYRYNEIPNVFTEIIICRNIFQYKPMINIWDNSGYLSGESVPVITDSETDLINSLELKRGWYESSDLIRKKTTPPEWILVKTEEESFWVSPDKIVELISISNFITITESLRPMPNDG